MIRALTFICLAPLALAVAVVAQPSPNPSGPAATSRVFWGALDRLGIVFKSMGSLSGGLDRGAIWIIDLRTGEKRRVGQTRDLAWPVLAHDDRSVFALRGRHVVKFTVGGTTEEEVGAEADWRKLLGVTPEGGVLGFIAGRPLAQAAILMPDGTLQSLPQPATKEEQRNASFLLQELREYRDGRRLEVRRSERGGRGFDVFLIQGTRTRNLSDCGDELCGQPSSSPDGNSVLYVRAPAS